MDEKQGWVYQDDGKKEVVLYRNGMWEARLATTVYSKGQVTVCAPQEKCPTFLGQPNSPIDDKVELVECIEEVSQKMVEALKCNKVYLVSLNESEKGVHFWLIPRYRANSQGQSYVNHEEFLKNKPWWYWKEEHDGYNLLSELRNRFIEAKYTGQRRHMPPHPTKDLNPQEDLKNWRAYAKKCVTLFEKVAAG